MSLSTSLESLSKSMVASSALKAPGLPISTDVNRAAQTTSEGNCNRV